jgi:hypothetical protein
MAPSQSPSAVIDTFVRDVDETFPETQSGKLVGHRDAIAKTTTHHDGERALHCARWAIRIAADRDLPHPEWSRIKELHSVWRDITWGAGFSAMEHEAHGGPLRDIEIEWVQDAVHVAKLVGEAEGWDDAPWEDLLVELIAMEPSNPAH